MPDRTDHAEASLLLPVDNAAVLAHVALLQSIITRLANNSAACKTWCLTLVAALLGLAGATHVATIIGFSLIPVIIFGIIDTMYLATEKAYRDLYEAVIGRIRSGKYNLHEVFEARAPVTISCFVWALLSWSIAPVYLGLVVICFVVYTKSS